MTPDEYRAALDGMNRDQRARFCSSYGWPADMATEEIVEQYAAGANPEALERIAVYRLRRSGGVGVATEAEKVLAVARESAEAAKVSADAALQSARSAWWAIFVALLTIIASIVVDRGC